MPDTIYFITNRTIEQRFWLKPSPDVNKILGSWLARAVQRYDIELFGVMFMSNHYHLIARAPNNNLSDFVGYFEGNVAKALNTLHERGGPLWARRFSAEPILDDDALVERLTYLLANPVQARLVARVQEWRGLNSYSVLVQRRILRYEVFRASDWHRAGQPHDRTRFMDEVELKHTPLPALANKNLLEQAADITRMIHAREEALKAERHVTGQRLIPMRVLDQQAPSSRPETPKQSPRPLCHTSCKERWKRFKEQWIGFVRAYRDAAAQYVDQLVDVAFPEGSFPPSRYPSPRFV